MPLMSQLGSVGTNASILVLTDMVTYTLDPDSLLVGLLVFAGRPSSYLTAGCALLLGIDVDGCLVDAGEGVVPGIVSGGSNIQINVTFKAKRLTSHPNGSEETKAAAAAAESSHGAVWPLLVADKVVGGEHHLADVTVEAGFMPVLKEREKKTPLCDFYIQAVKRLKR